MRLRVDPPKGMTHHLDTDKMTNMGSSNQTAIVQAIALLSHYAFDTKGITPSELVAEWLETYEPQWIRVGVVEALYQGRYKAISVEQILSIWKRRGETHHHFGSDFERFVSQKLPDYFAIENNPPADTLSKLEQKGDSWYAAEKQQSLFVKTPPVYESSDRKASQSWGIPVWHNDNIIIPTKLKILSQISSRSLQERLTAELMKESAFLEEQERGEENLAAIRELIAQQQKYPFFTTSEEDPEINIAEEDQLYSFTGEVATQTQTTETQKIQNEKIESPWDNISDALSEVLSDVLPWESTWELDVPSNQQSENEKVEDETLDQEILDQEILDQEILDQEILDQEILDQEILDQEILDQEILDHKILDHKILDHKILDHKILDHKILDHKILDHKILDHKILDDERLEELETPPKKEPKKKSQSPTLPNTDVDQIIVYRGSIHVFTPTAKMSGFFRKLAQFKTVTPDESEDWGVELGVWELADSET